MRRLKRLNTLGISICLVSFNCPVYNTLSVNTMRFDTKEVLPTTGAVQHCARPGYFGVGTTSIGRAKDSDASSCIHHMVSLKRSLRNNAYRSGLHT
ncbi:hypothetical protein F4604DRAFT_1765392 [Suillus subluteus]|nr:hypothetical protein F4604DRAFT_1765392 [Suillus subluteus]